MSDASGGETVSALNSQDGGSNSNWDFLETEELGGATIFATEDMGVGMGL